MWRWYSSATRITERRYELALILVQIAACCWPAQRSSLRTSWLAKKHLVVGNSSDHLGIWPRFEHRRVYADQCRSLSPVCGQGPFDVFSLGSPLLRPVCPRCHQPARLQSLPRRHPLGGGPCSVG